MRHIILLASALLFLAACGDDTSSPLDSGTPTDSGADSTPPVDSSADTTPPTDSAADTSPPADTGTEGCGDSRPDIGAITETEGLIVARDGTIFYTTSTGVGRLLPGGTPESFVSITAATIRGLALDAANETLFVGAPGNGIYRIDLTAGSPSAQLFVVGGSADGLTIGPDGFLYYSNIDDSEVNRVDPNVTGTGSPSAVLSSPIPLANGIAFESGGTLLVCSSGTGLIHRLTLTDGVETAREDVATVGAPDGIAVDEDGRLYITENLRGRLVRVEADGSGYTILATGIPAAASLDFGRGALSCSDIYIANSGTAARYEDSTANGADVPWH